MSCLSFSPGGGGTGEGSVIIGFLGDTRRDSIDVPGEKAITLIY